MSDYERNEAANVAAHKYRWVVWLAVPTIFCLAFVWICRNELVFLYYTKVF
jgi:hypothetical protein